MPRLSIKIKLSVIISLLVLSFIAFNAGYYPQRVERQMQRQSEADAKQLAEALGRALKPALDGGDARGVSRVLEDLAGSSSFRFCAVYDGQGKVVASSPALPEWIATGWSRLQGTSRALLRREEGLLVASAPVSFQSRPATLIIGYTTMEPQRTLRDNIRLGLWVGLSALVLGLAVAFYFGTRYIRPLRRLTEAASQVAEGNLAGGLVHVNSRDELEDLGRGFEAMTDRLRASGEEIARQNRSMEFRVQERTRQLMATIWELEEIRANLENLVQERTRGLEQSRAELKAWADTLEEKVRSKTLELTELNESLSESFQKLQEVDRMKDEFLANMSHELRTPLNAVIGFSGLLLQETADRIPDDVKEDLQIILQNGRSLLAMIDSILDLSKIEAGKFELECQAMDPMPLLENLRALAAGLILDRPIRFSCQVPPWQVRISGDPQRFKQVLTNLVGNAVKFTEQGDVSVSVEKSGGNLRISIQDTGIGMTREEIQRLFKPFQQVDGSITRRFGGTGLGLALSQRLIGLMGGRIVVSSEKGRGSTFVVEVPLLAGDVHG